MSDVLDFLSPVAAVAPGTEPGSDSGAVAAPVARSPMEALAVDAGARLQLRDGWSVAVSYPAAGFGSRVSWCDTSHLAKRQLQGSSLAIDAAAGGRLEFGSAVRIDDAWWLRLTQTRALVIGAGREPSDYDDVEALDVTCAFASLTVSGPLARECFARFCALDLRPAVTPVGAARPGSIARQPGTLIHEAEDRYLILFGWAIAEYMWSVVSDAAGALDGGPIGIDQLGSVEHA